MALMESAPENTHGFVGNETSVHKRRQVAVRMQRARCEVSMFDSQFGGCRSADVASDAWRWLASLLSISTFLFIPIRPIEDTKCAVLHCRQYPGNRTRDVNQIPRLDLPHGPYHAAIVCRAAGCATETLASFVDRRPRYRSTSDLVTLLLYHLFTTLVLDS